MWVWRDVEQIDIRQHVHRVALTPGSGPGDLWELVSELDGGRLDMSLPLWTSYLIDGLPDGRFALYVKIHHVVIDGVGGLAMIKDSLTRDPALRNMPPFYSDDPLGRRPQAKADKISPTKRSWIPNPLGAVRAVADAAAAGLDLTKRVASAETTASA